MTDPEQILTYWFGELEGPTDFDTNKSKLWWMGGDAIDREIRERFAETYEEAKAGRLDAWLSAPRSALALVILLDQFSRNLGRGTPEAFACDSMALKACQRAIEQGLDQQLRPIERGFLYMPMMHAEDREVAKRCVVQFEKLSQDIKRTCPSGHPDALSHAKQHAEIVICFGRYPHRNQILGRPSTLEEVEFLNKGGPTFGQTKS
jgi:uncharacterized protein (DUF924 family)